jgi:predicted nuclease of predicted toxin-antitoxin system
MKLLVDANLSPRVAARLSDAGHDVVHVRDVGLLTASDEQISSYAVAEGRTVISADSDFATILALGGHTAPSLVLLRSVNKLSPAEQADLLIANLPSITAYAAEGAVVSLSPTHLRVRPLPLRPPRQSSGR